ncbi:MAG: hypothetical protein SGBAC_013288 [Bacillariaceae sp.]
MKKCLFQNLLGGILFAFSVSRFHRHPSRKGSDIQSAQSYVQHTKSVEYIPQSSPRSSLHHSWPIPSSTANWTTVEELHELPIDEKSTIASDIDKIWHDMATKSICVGLKNDSRCPHPALLGRLSGPALALLDWSERPSTSDSDGGTLLCGDYSSQWLDAGYYFVEIIVLFCEDFGVTSLQQRAQDQDAWLDADRTSKCVEDARYNRITSKEGRTIINIPSSVEGKGSYRRGRWVRKPHLPLQALFTRYQPMECAGAAFGGTHIRKGTPLHQHCKSIVARDNKPKKKRGKPLKKGEIRFRGLSQYEFQWNTSFPEEQLIERLRQRQRDDNIPKICAIGDAHSRTMVERSLPALNLTGLFDYVQSNWIAPDKIVERISRHDCDHFFVQVGQWPASFWTRGHPFSFGKYYLRLKAHVENILAHNPNAKVYLPTIDQGPLMAKVNNCSDWRTPTMLNGYSHLNQVIANELGSRVEYVDNNFIIRTHWDGHPDWQHLLEKVRRTKALYMAAVMLGETEWFQNDT